MKHPRSIKLLISLCLIGTLPSTAFSQKNKDSGKNTSQASDNWAKGDMVEVQDPSGWLLATITDVKNLKYLIHFETQSKSDIWIMSNRIRKASAETIAAAKKAKAAETAPAGAAASSPYKVSDKVEVEEKGLWYPSAVLKIGNNQWFIHYDGYDSKYDIWVGPDRIRKMKTAPAASTAPNSAGKPDAATANAADNLLVIDTSLPLNMSGQYKVGDRVQAWHNGNGQFAWMESRILEIKDNQYKIYYGGSRYNVTWLDESKLRNAAREKAAEGKSAYLKDTEKFRNGLAMMSPDYWSWDNPNESDDNKIANLKQVSASLTELDKLMKEKYADFKDPSDITDKNYLPSHLRTLGAQRLDILSQISGKIIGGKLGGKLKSIKEDVAKVDDTPGNGRGIWNQNGEGNYADTYDVVYNNGQKTLAGVKTVADKFNQAAGITGDASAGIIADYQKAIAGAKAAFLANLPPASWNIPNKDATIEGVCKKFLLKEIPGAVILKSGVEDGGWEYEKTGSGIILSRRKWAAIQWKDSKSGLCCQSSFLYMEDALVNGGFQIPGFVTNLYGYVFTWSYQKFN